MAGISRGGRSDWRPAPRCPTMRSPCRSGSAFRMPWTCPIAFPWLAAARYREEPPPDTSWRSEPGSQRVAQSGICAVPHPGDVSIGSDEPGRGGCYLSQYRKLPFAGIFSVDQLNSIRPWRDDEAARLTEVE